MKQIYCVALLPTLLALSANFEAVQEKGEQALSNGQIKQAESLYTEFLKTAGDEDSAATKVRLAIAYYKDQEHEKAFKTFLDALDQTPIDHLHQIPSQDDSLYQKALAIYLDTSGPTPDEKAQKIFHFLQTNCKQKSNDSALGYLLAVGYANRGEYDKFFDEFYKSYRLNPGHFLAFKTKAALHIKLFERSQTDQQRQEHRQQILKNANLAADIQLNDSSLYRMIMGFTEDQLKAQTLSVCLNKIINHNIVVSRLDVPYYVEIAIAFHQYELAQKFLDRAKEWYAYSRVINVAQQHLDEQRGQNEG